MPELEQRSSVRGSSFKRSRFMNTVRRHGLDVSAAAYLVSKCSQQRDSHPTTWPMLNHPTSEHSLYWSLSYVRQFTTCRRPRTHPSVATPRRRSVRLRSVQNKAKGRTVVSNQVKIDSIWALVRIMYAKSDKGGIWRLIDREARNEEANAKTL